MRHIKTLCLASLSALLVVALFAAAPAAAEETGLCSVHEDPCSSEHELDKVHLENTTPVTILNSLAKILCLNVLTDLEALGADAPQLLDATSFIFSSCGSNSAHSDCTISVEELPSFTLLKTSLNLGEAEAENGLTRVKCVFFGFIKINCVYGSAGISLSAEGALHSGEAGNGRITASQAPLALKKSEGGSCPEEATLDMGLEAAKHTYIMHPPPMRAVLCKEHLAGVCPATKTYEGHIAASAPAPALETTGGFLSCGASTMLGNALELYEPLTIHITSWTFTNCFFEEVPCTAEATSSPALVLRTALNLGTFKVHAMAITIECPQLNKTRCVYSASPTIHIEGSTGAGLAGITASEAPLALIEGSMVCPETLKWSAAYSVTLPDPIYIGR